jgi:membrane peptidoglycan carboxypeptidase
MARACGIKSDLAENLTLALGTSEVSMLEITSAYGTFAAGGYHTDPLAIVNVKDSRGRTLEQHYPEPESVLDDAVARRIDYMLRQVVRVGTGRPAGSIPNARGKTGTTDDLRDAWFIGYTPDLVTAVWVGNDKPSRIPGLTGGGECAPIWVSYMRRALAILPRHAPPAALKPPKPKPADVVHIAESTPPADPAGETSYAASPAGAESAAPNLAASDPEGDVVRRRVCVVSGQLATRGCPETEVQAFARGSEPTETCALHGIEPARKGEVVVLCRDSGDLAGPRCKRLTTVRLAAGEPRPPLCPLHR